MERKGLSVVGRSCRRLIRAEETRFSPKFREVEGGLLSTAAPSYALRRPRAASPQSASPCGPGTGWMVTFVSLGLAAHVLPLGQHGHLWTHSWVRERGEGARERDFLRLDLPVLVLTRALWEVTQLAAQGKDMVRGTPARAAAATTSPEVVRSIRARGTRRGKGHAAGLCCPRGSRQNGCSPGTELGQLQTGRQAGGWKESGRAGRHHPVC